MCHVVTCGEQGPNLGADESEIVLLAYVIIDISLNKVSTHDVHKQLLKVASSPQKPLVHSTECTFIACDAQPLKHISFTLEPGLLVQSK